MKEKFSETYKKNAERMATAKTMYEMAMKQGNKELARKYRAEYSALKSEIDATLFPIIK